METSKQQQAITVRDLMPKNYLPTLEKRTGFTRAAISRVVNNEKTDSAIWPEVLRLAEETQKKKKLEQDKLARLKRAS